MMELLVSLIVLNCQPYLVYEKCIKDQLTCVDKVMTEKVKVHNQFTYLSKSEKMALAYQTCQDNVEAVLNGDFPRDLAE
jgi:hypothetical protein